MTILSSPLGTITCLPTGKGRLHAVVIPAYHIDLTVKVFRGLCLSLTMIKFADLIKEGKQPSIDTWKEAEIYRI